MIRLMIGIVIGGLTVMAYAMKNAENMGSCRICGSPTTMERTVCLGCDMVGQGHQDEGVYRRKF